MNPTPEPPVHFGLREQLIKQTYGAQASATTETESGLRTGPMALARGASVAAAALMNMALLVGTGEAQAQAPETAPAKKKTTTTTTTTTAATTEMPEVVVVGQSEGAYNVQRTSSPLYTEPLRDVPQTITVVPQAVIEQQNATTLRDVLRNVPGISMQAGEGGGGPGGDFLSIRGFNARNDIFIDGVRDFGGYTRDPFNLEQVEVVKGPASSYTGRGSTGGSINLSSKHAGLERSFYNANLGLGTDEYKRGTLDINQVLTPIHRTPDAYVDPKADPKAVVPPAAPAPSEFQAALRLNAMWHENEVANRDFVEQQRWGIAPTLTLGFGENTRIMLSYFHMEQDNQPDYGIPWVPTTQSVLGPKDWNKPSPVNYSNYYGLLERDYEDIVTDLGTIEFEQKFTEWFSLRNTVRYGETKRDSIYTAPRYRTGITDPDEVINRQMQARDQTDKILAEQFDTRFSFGTWGVKHEVVAGFDLTREEAENHLRATTGTSFASLYHPDANDNWSGDIDYTGAYNESLTNNAGVFLYDTLKFWEDKIQLSGGVRWDYYDAELTQRDAAGVTTEFSRTDKVWSYRVALAYKPVEIGTIYAAYGTSFNPSAEGAVSQNLLTDATAALEPEENRTIEIGTKWELLDKRLSVTAAVFQTDKTNARMNTVDPQEPVVLGGEQRVRGFEIGVAGSITNEWKVFGGYTYLESEVTESIETYVDAEGRTRSREGNELPQTPEHSFSLWTTYSLPWDIEVGTGVSYVGSRFSATDNLREAPDYWLWDAMISKQITKNIKAQINVYNLADEEYIDRVGGGHYVPGAGRTGMLTVGFNF